MDYGEGPVEIVDAHIKVFDFERARKFDASALDVHGRPKLPVSRRPGG